MAKNITLYRQKIKTKADYPSTAWLKEKRQAWATRLEVPLRVIEHAITPCQGSLARMLVLWIVDSNLPDTKKNRELLPRAFGLESPQSEIPTKQQEIS